MNTESCIEHCKRCLWDQRAILTVSSLALALSIPVNDAINALTAAVLPDLKSRLALQEDELYTLLCPFPTVQLNQTEIKNACASKQSISSSTELISVQCLVTGTLSNSNTRQWLIVNADDEVHETMKQLDNASCHVYCAHVVYKDAEAHGIPDDTMITNMHLEQYRRFYTSSTKESEAFRQNKSGRFGPPTTVQVNATNPSTMTAMPIASNAAGTIHGNTHATVKQKPVPNINDAFQSNISTPKHPTRTSLFFKPDKQKSDTKQSEKNTSMLNDSKEPMTNETSGLDASYISSLSSTIDTSNASTPTSLHTNNAETANHDLAENHSVDATMEFSEEQYEDEEGTTDISPKDTSNISHNTIQQEHSKEELENEQNLSKEELEKEKSSDDDDDDEEDDIVAPTSRRMKKRMSQSLPSSNETTHKSKSEKQKTNVKTQSISKKNETKKRNTNGKRKSIDDTKHDLNDTTQNVAIESEGLEYEEIGTGTATGAGKKSTQKRSKNLKEPGASKFFQSTPSSNEASQSKSQEQSQTQKRQKLVEQTYMDDAGYMVTEKVWVTDDEASDHETVSTPKSTLQQSKSPQNDVQPIKNKHTPNNQSSDKKQSSMMSFFKRS